jgi:hypothetical protein
MTFSRWGISDFIVQGWNGSGWITLATVKGNTLVKRNVRFPAFTTSRIRVSVSSALYGYTCLTEIEAWGTAAASVQTNVALASNGGTASASSTLNAGHLPANVVDGERAGVLWGNGGGWAYATWGVLPDWVLVDFWGQKTIDRVVLYTVQDNSTAPATPTDTMTFTKWGVTGFTVQGWNGSGWTTLATVTGNNLVKRTVTFAPFTTNRIRVNVNGSVYGYTCVTEIEAWGN